MAAGKHKGRTVVDKPAKAAKPAQEKPAPPPQLAQVRERIDAIDRNIQALIAERAGFALQVGRPRASLLPRWTITGPSARRRCCAWWLTATKAP